MLIQATLFVLMLLGVAALYIDLGLARLAQSQMQNSADAAALEGLRGSPNIPATCAALATPDEARRCAASSMAAFGDEPNLELAGGTSGTLEAGQIIDCVDTPAVPCPTGAGSRNIAPNSPPLETNFDSTNGNGKLQGDMLSGQYQPTLAATNGNMVTATGAHIFANTDEGQLIQILPSPGWTAGTYQITATSGGTATLDRSACASPPCTAGAWLESGFAEDSTYQRTDFVPAASPTSSAAASSFLVRLRRSGNAIDQNDPGFTSSGQPLPMLFGLGTPTGTTVNANGYSPRVNGITVRATAIADARPVLRVGPPPSPTAPGVLPLAVTHACWNTLGTGGTAVLTDDGTGGLTSPACVIPGHPLAGTYFATSPPPYVIGANVASLGTSAPVSAPSFAYVPIYDEGDPTSATNNLVIGFGSVSVTNSGSINITRLPSQIAPGNATGVITGGFPVAGSTLDAVFLANATLQDPLLAPVLVR